MKSKQKDKILERDVFQELLFAQCWEDPRMDSEALQPKPGDVILSVTSGGCNTLALSLLNPARILAIDLNPTQSCLLELKIAGVKTLNYEEYLELLGVHPSDHRAELYKRCRSGLSAYACRFWDSHTGMLEKGLLRSGRYERYLEGFRRLLILIQGRKRIRRLFELRSCREQRRFYDDQWNRWLWRLFFRVFFSRSVLGRAGLDPAFFTYVEGIDDFGQHFLSRARHALVDLPVCDNYFLSQICLGRYLTPNTIPDYLIPGNYEALRRGVERIEVITGELGSFLNEQPDNSVDAFNLSNVFEWVSPEVFERLLREIHRVGRPGARLCYRNLLVRRRHPTSLSGHFESNEKLAARLLEADRSFVYSNFEVATVVKPPRCREGS
jgi:S-adenosylmethionine-diacylglycerol 3-amino-3-carboxypropyl transferase